MFNLLNEGKFTEFLFYGASRSGKTFLILYWMICQAIAMKANSLIIREMFTSLFMGMLRQTLPAVLKAIAKINGVRKWEDLKVGGIQMFKYNYRDNTLSLFNGAYIQFASLRSSSDGKESSYDKILSTEWGHIFLDEVSEIDYAAVEALRSRLSQKFGGRNCILFALNPTSKLHWTYKRFFEHKSQDGTPIPEKIVRKMYIVHFKTSDNEQFVSEDYIDELEGLSAMNRQRFLDGEYQDVGQGKVFTRMTWLTRPDKDNICESLIYTDPSSSAKQGSDFKASVLLVRTLDSRIWMWDCRAVVGTTREMLENIYELYISAPMVPRIIIEKRQVPQDFQPTFERFCQEKGWTASIHWDTLNHGDKFTCIESTLEPLVNTGKFVFCKELQKCGCYEHIIDQFVRFGGHNVAKDDIPDATAKGTTFFNFNIARQRTEGNMKVFFYRRGKYTSFKQVT